MKTRRLFHGIEVGDDVTALLLRRNIQAGPLLANKVIRLGVRGTRVGPPTKEFTVTHPTYVLNRKPWERGEDDGLQVG